MRIRPATSADVDELAELERALFGADAWSSATVARGISGTSVCTEGGAVLGYVVTSVAGETADLERIGVRPQQRRTGIGRALLAAAVEAVRGADRMLVEVRADNAAARAFYAVAGFSQIAQRRGYYRDGIDALVLARPLGMAP